MFVAGINCSKQNAYAEMVSVQKRFGMKGKVVAYHGIQSFKHGEVTPEEAFEIGKETARRMWGDKYQILVTVHLNTESTHCHLILNPCSFKDGQKFKNKIGDHIELRKVSDQVCLEYGKSVLKDSNFYSKGNKKEYWVRKNGQMSHRDMIKGDIEYALQFCDCADDVYVYLKSIGYTISKPGERKHLTITAPGWQRPVRLDTLGFTTEYLNKRLNENYNNPDFIYFKRRYPPYRPKRFPLLYEMEKLDFTIQHSHDTGKILVSLLFLVIICTFELLHEVKNTILLSADLRHEAREIKQYVSDYHFMRNNNIETMEDLYKDIESTKAEISQLEKHRSEIDNKRRRAKTPDDIHLYKEQRKEITKQITPLRKRLKQAEKIWDKSPHLLELVKQEHTLETQAKEKQKIKERGAR